MPPVDNEHPPSIRNELISDSSSRSLIATFFYGDSASSESQTLRMTRSRIDFGNGVEWNIAVGDPDRPDQILKIISCENPTYIDVEKRSRNFNARAFREPSTRNTACDYLAEGEQYLSPGNPSYARWPFWDRIGTYKSEFRGGGSEGHLGNFEKVLVVPSWVAQGLLIVAKIFPECERSTIDSFAKQLTRPNGLKVAPSTMKLAWSAARNMLKWDLPAAANNIRCALGLNSPHQ